MTAGALTISHRQPIIALAARHELPAVYPARFHVTAGGLISYQAYNVIDQFRRAAGYVDRILKGEKPAQLPVQAPTKYELFHQSQDRQGARPRRAADAACPRRRADRMIAYGTERTYRGRRPFDRDRTRRHHAASGAGLQLPDEIMGAERSAPDAPQAASLELLWTDPSVCRANPLHPGGGLLIRLHDIARLEIARAAVPCRLLVTQSGPCERAVRGKRKDPGRLPTRRQTLNLSS